jgi:hypothetical protein
MEVIDAKNVKIVTIDDWMQRIRPMNDVRTTTMVRTVKDAKRSVLRWLESTEEQFPGLCGAHFVGGITSMRDDEPFPRTKDVDLHLIFEPGSPALDHRGRFMNILEVAYDGLAIEAGIRSRLEYGDASMVLGNPEIAHHLLTDSVIDDPGGWLHDLQVTVRDNYARRQWVCARLNHERRGLAGALAMRKMAASMTGVTGELSVLGYATTYLAATLAVVTLSPPRIGGRMFVTLGAMLRQLERSYLHEEILGYLGVRDVAQADVERFLAEGAELFDWAVAVRRTPHPFQHKLHPHLRPYFVDSCQAMIDEGYHREALGWITPFYCASVDVILADGRDDDVPLVAAKRDRFLRSLGLDDPSEMDNRYERAQHVFNEVFVLADYMTADNPMIVD